MPQNGLVRGKMCSEGPHSHTQAGVPGTFRAWDDAATIHITGSGEHPRHGSHFPPPGTHSHTLQHIHTMIATNTETFINDKPPLLEGDAGCWACCCDDDIIFDFVVDKNTYDCYIEDKSILVQGIAMINSGSVHEGSGKITNGGSGDTFVGVFKVSAEPDG